MALEAVEALPESTTHVFLQAGVGAMSGAVAGFLADYYGDKKPVITIVEQQSRLHLPYGSCERRQAA